MSESEAADPWVFFLLGILMKSVSGHDTVFLVLFGVVSEVMVDHLLFRDIVSDGGLDHLRVET